MLISDLAARTGHTVDTIRFYQKLGLLDDRHFIRAGNKYRHYTAAAVDRLTLIQQAQAAGITLAELRQSVDEWEAGTMSIADKVDLIRRKLDQINDRIATLEQIKAYLLTKLTTTTTP
jgi:DNA-binding transcriptional MerR regulator